MYIYENKKWPYFTWDNDEIISLLAAARKQQGLLLGKMQTLGFEVQNDSTLTTLIADIKESSAIEGEKLDSDQIRSSVARKLQLDLNGLVRSDKNIDGIVEMVFDATEYYNLPLTKQRLFKWHSYLFPEQPSFNRIIIGDWRDDSTGPMQIVSGPIGYEKVHFQAPKAKVVGKEMDLFFDWFNNENKTDLFLKAAIAHFWFVTIHPFEDGNGRIGRVISDMLLAKADDTSQRYYSLSAEIKQDKKEYYKILEHTSKGDMDITDWLKWYLDTLMKAILNADNKLNLVLLKNRFWNENNNSIKNQRQSLMINKLLDGFEGKLTTTKWAKIAKCSTDTALRDIQDLIGKGILVQGDSGGRSTSYELKVKIKY